MKIILSPSKKMKTDVEGPEPAGLPVFMEKTKKLQAWLTGMSFCELKNLWACSVKTAEQNCEHLEKMDLYRNLTPAVLAYEGLAYQYMAPAVFETAHFGYVQEHLRILSAFYGVLKAMDGVVPYRLEMQADGAPVGFRNMYEFWGDSLYRAVRDESGIIISLASAEYSKCIERYLMPEDRYITVNFCEKAGDRLVTRGTHAKMARGEMVRFMAENRIEDPCEIRNFDRLGYTFRDDLSCDRKYVFERMNQQNLYDGKEQAPHPLKNEHWHESQ